MSDTERTLLTETIQYTGSVVFQVQKALFRLPTAFLQVYLTEEGFEALHRGDPDIDEAVPIELDDPLEPFQDWIEILFCPVNSCLNPAHPSRTNLERMLNILIMCHKYRSMNVHACVLSSIITMTRADTLPSNLTQSLTPYRIVEVAHGLALPQIAEYARIILLEQLWSKESVDPYVLLGLGERIRDREILGAAYYALSIPKSQSALDPRLGSQYQMNIRFGRERCAAEWQKLADTWGDLAVRSSRYHSNCSVCRSYMCSNIDHGHTKPDWLFLVWKRLAKKKLVYHDIVEKVVTALECLSGTNYGVALGCDVSAMTLTLQQIKTNMLDWFLEGGKSIEKHTLMGSQVSVLSLYTKPISPSPPKPAISVQRYSMNMQTGLKTLLIGSASYKLPNALLQHNSEFFSGILEIGRSDEGSIAMDESETTFIDWFAMLIFPHLSCMEPSNPTRLNLRRLLDLALFCHKYQFSDMQRFVESLALPMMQPNTFPSHITNEVTTFNVLKTAHILDNVKMATTPRDMVLKGLWEEGSTTPFEALMLGENINDKVIIGTAYYQILVSKSPRWTEDGRLSERHCRHLEYGNNRCIAESLSCLELWGRWAVQQHPRSTLHSGYSGSGDEYRWLHLVLTEIAKGNYALGDVVKRYEVALRVEWAINHPTGNLDLGLTNYRQKLEEGLQSFKVKVYDYFVEL